MDTTANEITFDDNGVCSYCTEFIERSGHLIHENNEDKEKRLVELVSRVKSAGHGKPYDCIVGVSGGVDSSWVLVKVVELGLRPLAVHMDNGWNSELAQNNITNLVRELDIDLYTHVIDWEEYRSLMQAFFDSNAIDIELLYDNAMFAVNYQNADKFGIKYILSGMNQATEGMMMPSGWNWYKFDKRNIKDIARLGNVKQFSTFPVIGTLDYVWFNHIKHIRWVSFLDFLPFNKEYALSELESKYGYVRYPYKHYESIFTRFYQGYILPNKFNVDKRKIHLSTLVVTGQMSRSDALELLHGIAYPSESDLDQDIQYFLKKMRWKMEDLRGYLSAPPVSHYSYKTEKHILHNILSIIPRSIKNKLKKIASAE